MTGAGEELGGVPAGDVHQPRVPPERAARPLPQQRLLLLASRRHRRGRRDDVTYHHRSPRRHTSPNGPTPATGETAQPSSPSRDRRNGPAVLSLP